MKVLIISLGFVVGCAGFFMGCVALDRGNQKAGASQRLEAEISGLKQKIVLLKDIPQREAVHLGTAYTAFMNDMHVIAGVHRAVCKVSLQGKGGPDVEKDAAPSMFTGLREVRFYGVFTGITRRTMFLSLLDALSAFEKEVPVLLRSIRYEKDVLMIDITVMGI